MDASTSMHAGEKIARGGTGARPDARAQQVPLMLGRIGVRADGAYRDPRRRLVGVAHRVLRDVDAVDDARGAERPRVADRLERRRAVRELEREEAEGARELRDGPHVRLGVALDRRAPRLHRLVGREVHPGGVGEHPVRRVLERVGGAERVDLAEEGRRQDAGDDEIPYFLLNLKSLSDGRRTSLRLSEEARDVGVARRPRRRRRPSRTRSTRSPSRRSRPTARR